MIDKLEDKPSLKTLTGRTLMLIDTLQATVRALNEFSTRVMATLVIGAEQADAEIEALVGLGSIGALYTQLLGELDTFQIEDCCKQEIIKAERICKQTDLGNVGICVARDLFRGNARSRRYAIALNRLLVARAERQPAVPVPTPPEAPVARARTAAGSGKGSTPVTTPIKENRVSHSTADSVLSRLQAIKMAGRRTKGALTLIVTELEGKQPVTDKQRKYLVECANKIVALAPLKTELVRLAQAT